MCRILLANIPLLGLRNAESDPGCRHGQEENEDNRLKDPALPGGRVEAFKPNDWNPVVPASSMPNCVKRKRARSHKEKGAADDRAEISNRWLVVRRECRFVSKHSSNEFGATLYRDQARQNEQHAGDRHPLPNLGQMLLIHEESPRPLLHYVLLVSYTSWDVCGYPQFAV
jgi:hypothetical protein